MNTPKFSLLSITAVTALLSGCVTGHRTVEFSAPQPVTVAPADEKGTVNIATITDDRVFQNRPSDPSIPSIKGDVAAMTDGQKIRMIGRQRNTYGAAAGDLALPEGDSILARTRVFLERGFAAEGYRSVNGSDAPVSANVSVKEFWAWATPGFWSAKVEARIECAITLNIDGETKSLVVEGYGVKGSSTAITNQTWEIVYNSAYDDFVEKLSTALDSAGL